MSRSIVVLILAVAIVTGTAGCKASSSKTTTSSSSDGGAVTTQPTGPIPVNATVKLLDPELVFSPDRVVIHAGRQVTWTWPGGTAHNVTFEDFASGTFTQGTFTHVFLEPGTYKYECTLHSADGKGMVGEVDVVP